MREALAADASGGGGGGSDDAAALLPVAKACKLDSAQRPRDARDPRRSNRVLHLCQSCGVYKQSTEYYLCCLHDTQRCCRECMLGRPNEPFGEHAYEEQRTRAALKLADALLDLLASRLLEAARSADAGRTGAGTLPRSGSHAHLSAQGGGAADKEAAGAGEVGSAATEGGGLDGAAATFAAPQGGASAAATVAESVAARPTGMQATATPAAAAVAGASPPSSAAAAGRDVSAAVSAAAAASSACRVAREACSGAACLCWRVLQHLLRAVWGATTETANTLARDANWRLAGGVASAALVLLVSLAVSGRAAASVSLRMRRRASRLQRRSCSRGWKRVLLSIARRWRLQRLQGRR